MLSAELQQRYATEVDVDWTDVLLFAHSTGWYAITNHHEQLQGQLLGQTLTFSPVPFEARLPIRNGEGQQDMELVVCGVEGEMARALEAAITKPEEPVICYYSIYIIGNQTPQLDPPLELALTDISLTEEAMSATATRYNVFNQPFPSIVYRGDVFPGLVRR